MNTWSEPYPRQNVIAIPTFGIAIALSILLHVVVLLQWKLQSQVPKPDQETPPPLTVKLEPMPGPPMTRPLVVPPPSPAIATPSPRTQPAAPPSAAPPPVIALTPPAPTTPAPVEPAVPAPLRIPPAADLASYIETQRRARGDTATAPPQPAEDENARATRLAVANLGSQKAQPLPYDPSRSGGVFQIKSKGVDYAEFMFYGWHADARRDLSQLVEVRKGGNATIELAVVRKMIEIIRTHEQADFSWRSHRLNRNIMLSARPRDSTALEEFLMREFFYNPRIAP
jgi:hypothetical protein